MEVPFAYVEHGERKSALVKLVLCERCSNKLLWKRRKERAALSDIEHGVASTSRVDPDAVSAGAESEDENEASSQDEKRSSPHNVERTEPSLRNRSPSGVRPLEKHRDRDSEGSYRHSKSRRRDRSSERARGRRSTVDTTGYAEESGGSSHPNRLRNSHSQRTPSTSDRHRHAQSRRSASPDARRPRDQ